MCLCIFMRMILLFCGILSVGSLVCGALPFDVGVICCHLLLSCTHTQLHLCCIKYASVTVGVVPRRVFHLGCGTDITTLKGVIIFPLPPSKSDIFTKRQVYSLINPIFPASDVGSQEME